MTAGPGAARTTTALLMATAGVVVASHAPLIGLPYFWDELGQFVPSALDILRHGWWVPHSAVPNSHPPGLMAYLALAWRIFGCSIEATRGAMLGMAVALAAATFLLARRLCGNDGAAWMATLFLVADPLFYTQGMMAQLDMPAALLTVLALVLYLDDRQGWAAVCCTALVMVKETSIVTPALLAWELMRVGRRREGAYYAAPAAALAIWFAVLWRTTGHVFGDSGYTQYNLTYPLEPAHLATSILRRGYYLLAGDFRWIGTIALWAAWRRSDTYKTNEWRTAGRVAGAQAVLVTVLGGAALERYLMPVLPVLYAAMGAAIWRLRPRWRAASAVGLAAGLTVSLFVNPPYPFPYENNLAVVDFVRLHQAVGAFLERNYSSETVYTAWPLTAALRRPEYGYVKTGMRSRETSDLRRSTLEALDPAGVRVLVLYSRTWDPPWGVTRWGWVARFLGRYYDYEAEMSAADVEAKFHLKPVARWQRRGQWAEIYAATGASGR